MHQVQETGLGRLSPELVGHEGADGQPDDRALPVPLEADSAFLHRELLIFTSGSFKKIERQIFLTTCNGTKAVEVNKNSADDVSGNEINFY